ncbi:MAG: hypothetical protein WDA22_08225 [Bacteroidota bacterium]
MNFLELNINTKRRLLILSIIAVIVVIHTPPQRLHYWNADLPEIHFLRSILFLLSILFFFSLVAKPIILFFSELNGNGILKKTTIGSAKIFAFVSLLVFPATLGIMGVGYSYMSASPFTFVDISDQLYQRLLMPAAAFFLFARGTGLYHVFSLLIAFGALFLLQLFFIKRNISLTTLEYVSIATSSFLITQFQSPGYTEPLSYIFILILLTMELDELSRVALISLSLCAHEGSMLVMLVVSMIIFTRREVWWIIVIGGFYGFIWIASYGFDVPKILAVRSVGQMSTLEWIVKYPWRETLGIFFSLKLLWLFIFIALFRIKQQRLNILLYTLPGIVLTLAAVDTSRMAGFSFVALLYSIIFIKQNNILKDNQFKLACAINLCIPAVYVGLNSGIVYFDGVYQLLQFGIFIK